MVVTRPPDVGWCRMKNKTIIHGVNEPEKCEYHRVIKWLERLVKEGDC